MSPSTMLRTSFPAHTDLSCNIQTCKRATVNQKLSQQSLAPVALLVHSSQQLAQQPRDLLPTCQLGAPLICGLLEVLDHSLTRLR